MMRWSLIVLLFFLSEVYAQQVTISGQVVDPASPHSILPKLMVVNLRSGQGIFAQSDGQFSIRALQTDTLMFSALGYHHKKVCLRDSLAKSSYRITVGLQKLYFNLKEVSVFAPRTLSEIDQDIARLDSTRRYRAFKEINGLESPITYLYERFSKFGQSRQKVAEWENEDLKKEILKDLFRVYVRHEIIDLSEEEFEAFIQYCNLSEYFIKTATQFELVMAIKGKYESFSQNKDYYIPKGQRW